MYKPPFSITSYMLEKSISIANKLGKISSHESLERMPILRRNNRIRSKECVYKTRIRKIICQTRRKKINRYVVFREKR